MFKNLKLWAKIAAVTGINTMIVVVALIYTNLTNMQDVIATSEREELINDMHSIHSAIAAQAQLAESLSAFVANISSIQAQFANKQRKQLLALLEPSFAVLHEHYGAAQFQFHLPPATSFLRLHKPGEFGDDLSSFRHMVVKTNAIKQPQRGLENGRAGLGVRGIVPVFNQGQHIGSVEFGMNFNQSFFDHFKADYNLDIALFLLRDGIKQIQAFADNNADVSTSTTQSAFVPFAHTLQSVPLLSEKAMNAAITGKQILEYRTVNNRVLAIYLDVIKDFSGQPIGVLEIAKDHSKYAQQLDRARDYAYIVGFLAFLIGLVLAILTARGMTRHLKHLAAGVDCIASGDLAVTIDNCGNDEIGKLAASVQVMRQNLHDVIATALHHAELVSAATLGIIETIDNQAATSSEISSAVAEITSTMEQFSASSEQIAEHAKSVAAIANRTWDTSKKGSQAMGMVMQKMEEIRRDNQNSLQEIMALGHKSKEITKVMKIINGIADQTKLIAFNAALEAASAGESGRRFGVVAAEIRRLADNVTASTGDIEVKINEIQNAIHRLVVTSEKGVGSIDAGMSASSHTVERLAELETATHQTTSAGQQISLSTQQQRTASNQVVIALREIVTGSANIATSIQFISSVSNDTATLSAKMKQTFTHFKLQTDTIAKLQ